MAQTPWLISSSFNLMTRLSTSGLPSNAFILYLYALLLTNCGLNDAKLKICPFSWSVAPFPFRWCKSKSINQQSDRFFCCCCFSLSVFFLLVFLRILLYFHRMSRIISVHPCWHSHRLAVGLTSASRKPQSVASCDKKMSMPESSGGKGYYYYHFISN